MLVNTSKGQKKIKVIKEKTILELLQENDVYLEAICGGRGVCGKCRIKILTGRLPVTLKDEKYFTKEELQRGYRLACSAYPHNNLEITIDFCEEDFSIVSRFHKKQKFVNTGMAITEVNLEDVNWHKINSMDLAVKSILQESHHLSYKALKALSKVITSYVKGGNNKLKAPVNLLIKKGIILDAFYNIDKVYLAGGFGSNINMDNAVKIGLIPEELKEKIEISGNSSLGGTVKYLLDKDCKRYLEVIKKKSRGINLSNSVKFNNYFIKNISF